MTTQVGCIPTLGMHPTCGFCLVVRDVGGAGGINAKVLFHRGETICTETTIYTVNVLVFTVDLNMRER